jgi:hypothetical protein
MMRRLPKLRGGGSAKSCSISKKLLTYMRGWKSFERTLTLKFSNMLPLTLMGVSRIAMRTYQVVF